MDGFTLPVKWFNSLGMLKKYITSGLHLVIVCYIVIIYFSAINKKNISYCMNAIELNIIFIIGLFAVYYHTTIYYARKHPIQIN